MIPYELIDTALKAAESAYRNDWDIHIDDPETSATATILSTPDFTILAFKGSAEFTDWKINALAMPYHYAGAWVHLGFKMAHASIWPHVRNELIRAGRKPLIVTGHSLGGAMAELTCLFLQDYPADVHMVSFGKPNVFLRPAKPRMPYLKTQISVVSGSDIVTRLPRHFYCADDGQSMLYLANDGQDYLIPKMDDMFHDMIRRDWKLADSANDHVLPVYRHRLNRHLAVQPRKVK